MPVKLLESAQERTYHEYVKKHPHSTIFHTLGWKRVLEETYGYKPLYTILEDKGKIVGVCPAFLVKTIKGNSIVSQPFAEYGYPLVNRVEDIQKFIEFYKSFDADVIEFRESPFYPIAHENKKLNGYLYYLDIAGKDFDNDIWHGVYTKKSGIRKAIRKANNSGIHVCETKDIDTYYSFYIKRMKELGSPPHAKSLFTNINSYVNCARFTMCYTYEIPIGVMLTFYHGKTALMWNMASNLSYSSCMSNDVLYNEQIKHALDVGCSRIDFGRTQPRDSYMRFKSKWGSKQAILNSVHVKGESIDKKKFLFLSPLVKHAQRVLCNPYIGPQIKRRFP